MDESAIALLIYADPVEALLHRQLDDRQGLTARHPKVNRSACGVRAVSSCAGYLGVVVWAPSSTGDFQGEAALDAQSFNLVHEVLLGVHAATATAGEFVAFKVRCHII